jgi:Family of unknown function (DUF6188)
MSEVGFLVGRAVVAVRRNPDGSARIIFDLGDRPESALYADVGACIFEDRSGVALVPASMVSSVVSDTSTDDGTLMLSFANGSLLRCEPDARYEAWQVVGGSPQSLVVCQPGGELAVWDSSHVPTETEAQETAELLKRTLGWDVQVREVTETGGIIVEPRSKPEDGSVEADDS